MTAEPTRDESLSRLAELPPAQPVEQRRQELILSLGLFDLTERDRRLIDWLASWDQSTVAALADLFARLGAPGRAR